MGDPPIQHLSGQAAAAIDRLRLDAATAEVSRAFARGGISMLLLKGRSLDSWLYPGLPRVAYLDVDLLVEPSAEAAAANSLRKLGFQQRFDQAVLPSWWREHGTEWARDADGVLVDLHNRVSGVGVDPAAAWDVFLANSEPLEVGGADVRALSLPGRALLVALHAAHHGADGPKPLEDLGRALEVADDSLWTGAAALAAQLDATEPFAAGLRLSPAGAAVAERLALSHTRSVKVALHASTPPPVALGFEQLASASSLPARVKILTRKLFPPPGFIRHWWPPAGRSRAMLVIGYLRRPIWLLQHAPRGFRSWREARRQVRRGS